MLIAIHIFCMADYNAYIQPVANYWRAEKAPQIAAVYETWLLPGKRRWRRITAGYQNLPNDAGNYTGCQVGVGNQAGTNMSISACALAGEYGNIDSNFMQNLDIPFAIAWYKPNLWDEIFGDQIQDQLTAELIADMYSSAKSNATKALQRALNSLGENLAVDGGFGPLTLAALNRQISRNKTAVYNRFRDQMIQFYQGTGSSFTQGWIDSLNRDYPPLKETSTLGITVFVLAAGALGYYWYNNR